MSESNQHYGRLNERFEIRARQLRQLGYKYTGGEYRADDGNKTNLAAFTLPKYIATTQTRIIFAITVSQAEEAHWEYVLRDASRGIESVAQLS